MVLQYLHLQVTKFDYHNFLDPQSCPALTAVVFNFQFSIFQHFNLFEHQSFQKRENSNFQGKAQNNYCYLELDFWVQETY